MFICSTHRRSRSSATDNQRLPVGHSQHRDLLRLPSPKRAIILATPEESPSRDSACETGMGQSRLRLPITAAIMHLIRTHLERSDLSHKQLLWAICCTAFFGFFQLGELLPESCPGQRGGLSDFGGCGSRQPRETNNGDQFGAGAHIILGRTGSPLCPVMAILEYIEIRGSSAGPFFQGTHSQPVLKTWFVEQLRSILAAAGLPQQQYARHSFRIGAATTAALAGVEDSMIQTLGRWQSGAFFQYIRTPSEKLANLSSVLARRESQNTQS